MQETEVIKGELSKTRASALMIVGLISFLISLMVFFYLGSQFGPHSIGEWIEGLFLGWIDGFFFSFVCLVCLALLVAGIIYYVASHKVSITVTDKRVYGTALWKKRVDLPLDAISAVSTSFFKGISVASSSGAIKFVNIENNEEVHKEISKLLIDRQGQAKENVNNNNNRIESNAEEIGKYKELLDNGIITQEEFEIKKKQLLGL